MKVESLGYLLQDLSICPFLLSENPLWRSEWTAIPAASSEPENNILNDKTSKSFKLRFRVLNIQQGYRQVRWWPISLSCNTCPAWRASPSSKKHPNTHHSHRIFRNQTWENRDSFPNCVSYREVHPPPKEPVIMIIIWAGTSHKPTLKNLWSGPILHFVGNVAFGIQLDFGKSNTEPYKMMVWNRDLSFNCGTFLVSVLVFVGVFGFPFLS